MAAIAAVMSMQDSVEKSIQFGKWRLLGTFLGGLFGIVFTSFGLSQINPLVTIISVFIGVVIFIYICNCLKTNESIIIGLVVFIIIALDSGTDFPLIYAASRILNTMVGIVIAILVNRYLFNPDSGYGPQNTDEPND